MFKQQLLLSAGPSQTNSAPDIRIYPVVDVIKLFLEEILISPKLRNWKTFVLMSEPAQKCVNNAISNQNYAQKLFIAFKMAYSCCFGLRGNLDFPDFLQKKFYNIGYWKGFNQRILTYFVRGSITIRLTSCLTDLNSTKLVNLYRIQHKQSNRILTSQTGGQPYSDTSPYEVFECSLIQ